MANSMEMGSPKIIYIAGYGRSGSTILDIVLGNHRDIVSMGEVANLFQAEMEKKQCSCGNSCDKCPVWSPIVKLARSSNQSKWGSTSEIMHSVESIGSVIPTLFGLPSKGRASEAIQAIYSEQMRSLFAAIKKVTKVSTVVDSSKTAWRTIGRPFALYAIGGLDVRVIHLIRDGRAVMWSTMKGSDPDIEHNHAKKSTLRGYQKVLNWGAVNILTSLILRKIPKNNVMRVHYEDFVDRPEEILERIGAFVGLDTRELKGKIAQNQQFAVGHLFRGNRIAREKKEISLIPDYSWKEKLAFHDYLFYWLILWPVALIYRRDRS